MSKMTINKLYIFSPSEEKAKYVEFSDSLNIITSDAKRGNQAGKSTIAKSIYHTLGADCFFNGTWSDIEKVYIVEYTIEDSIYQILRAGDLFKIFKKEKLEFKTSNRTALNEYLSKIFKFAVYLPDRKDNLTLTPPVFSYLLNFIDQDKYDGANFKSFDKLTQFANIKKPTLYSHFGIFNDEYYSLLQDLDIFNKQKAELIQNRSMLVSFVSKLQKDIVETDYSTDFIALQNEISRYESVYSDLTNKLAKIKSNLISARNIRLELKNQIKALNSKQNQLRREAVKILEEETCPKCHSHLKDDDILSFHLKDLDVAEDLLNLEITTQQEIEKIERKISLDEQKYQLLVDKLNEYNELIFKKENLNSTEILRQQGILQIKDKLELEIGANESSLWELQKKEADINKILELEIGANESSLWELQKKEADINKILKGYNDKIRKVNDLYYVKMKEAFTSFKIAEIGDKQIKKIDSSISPEGSNNRLVTTIWYYTLLNIKYQLANESLIFPIVLDGPLADELDEKKYEDFLDFLITQAPENSQIIMTILESDYYHLVNNYKKYEIKLTNDKYSLLSHEDYEKHFDVLEKYIRIAD